MTRVADYIIKKILLRYRLHNALILLLSSNLYRDGHTFFNGLIGQLEISLDVLCFEIEERKDDVSLIGRDLQMLQTCGGGNDGPDIVLSH